jgi:hypothetical protein
MRNRTKMLQGITMVTQLGVSLITPPLVCGWLANRLQEKYALGSWVALVGIAIGILASVSTAFNFYRKFCATKHHDDDDAPPTSFNSHD